MKERDWLLFLHQLDGIGSLTLKKLGDYLKKYSDVMYTTEQELKEWGLNKPTRKQILSMRSQAEQIVETIDRENLKHNIQTVTKLDSDYPSLLLEIYDSPGVLFVLGDKTVLQERMISVVGTREPSYYGKWVAQELGAYLADNHIPVVSGLAKGIDRFVHEGALRHSGTCVAVVASGFSYIYPQEHKKLFNNIVETGGCIVTEYSYHTKANPGNFPARNRIISGLSLATIVVESKSKGGALITADQALEQNREVFAVPGNINSPNSQGTNGLLKQGAKLLTKWDDIFEELQEFQDKRTVAGIKATKNHDISMEESLLLQCIPFEAIHIDQLQELYKGSDLFLLLVQLQCKNFISALPGQYYVRIQQ